MNFHELCEFFEEIKQTKGPTEKSKLICNRFSKIRENIQSEIGTSFFQILRLLLPKLDRDRDSYNMKEAKVARTLIKMLDLPAGHDQNVLSKSYLMSAHATDFGDVVYSVLRKYLSNCKTTLTLLELNRCLDDLTKKKSESEAQELMMQIFKKASPEHIRWIIRIILKDLKLGIGSNTILNCYHRDAATFYASNNNLRKVCEILADRNVKLHEIEIEIFEAFRPMLSKKIDANNFQKELPENKLFYVENKFDGERFQLHFKDNEFRYFSRNGFDYTENLGKSYDTGLFTPKLKGLIKDDIKSVILDGELMLWDKYSKKFGSKGMELDVKQLKAHGKFQPCFCIYDMILLNGTVLTNSPLKERVKLLQSIFKRFESGTISLSKIKEVNSRQDIVDELNLATDKEEEGIIVKDPDSIYKYSDRNSGWYKMKLEFFQDVMNDLDLILMGGSYAESTSVKLTSFIVGIRSGSAENGRPLYLALGRVSSGLNEEELTKLNKKLKSEGKKIEDFSSENLLFGKKLPNYYIEPEHSLIFQIRASELTRCSDNAYKTSYTLRFPRVLKVREDKPVDECLSINELLELTKNNKSVIKLNKRHVELEEILKTKKKKLKKQDIVMPTIFETKKVSDLLEGYNIFVMSGNQDVCKENAESFIKRAGGNVSYRASDKVDIILVGVKCDQTKRLIKQRNKYDIVNVNWLQRVIQDGNLLGYDQEEVYYLGYSYKNCLSDELDMYGDSYTLPTTVEKLKRTFEIISEMGECSNQNNTIEFEGFRKKFGNCLAYFDKYMVPNNSHSENIYDSFLDEIEFKFNNGSVSYSISENVNLIVYNGVPARKKLLIDYLVSINRTDIKVVPKTFIYE